MKKKSLMLVYLFAVTLFMFLPQVVSAKSSYPSESEEQSEEHSKTMTLDGVFSSGDLLVEEIEERGAGAGYDHSYDARIVTALENLETELDVSGSGLTTGNVESVITPLLNRNPQLFFINLRYSYSYNSQRELTTLRFSLTASKDKIRTQQQEVKEALQEALDAVDTSRMTAEEIALFYHDYLANQIAYAKDEYESGKTTADMYSVYGALVNHKAVCQGYAMAFMYIMQQYDIPCGYASSVNINHGWNVVKMGDGWYHMDVTWDDPVYDNLGYVRHDYFLITKSKLISLSPERTDLVVSVPLGESYSQPAASSFLNKFWNRTIALSYYYKGYWYYMDKSTFKLIKHNYGSGESVTVLEDSSVTWGMAGNYSKLAGNCNMLYYTTPKSIYAWDLENIHSPAQEVFTSRTTSGAIYGMAIQQGKLFYVVKENLDFSRKESVIPTGISPAGHQFYLLSQTEPTCLKDGSNVRICSLCGKTETTLVPATKDISQCTITLSETHFIYDGSAKKPEVEIKDGDTPVPESGYTLSYSNNTEAGTAGVAAAGANGFTGNLSAEFWIEEAMHIHSWDGGTVTTRPGCMTPGVMTYRCEGKDCDEIRTSEIPPTNDISTCSILLSADQFEYDGSTKEPKVEVRDGNVSVPENAYSVSYENNIQPGKAFVIVRGTGNFTGTLRTEFSILSGVTESHVHVWDSGTELSAPGCTSEGEKLYTCTVSGCRETKRESVPALGHVEIVDEAEEPTCSRVGKTQGSHCKRCFIVITKRENIPKLEHQYQQVVKEKATPERDGGIVNRCTECGSEDKAFRTVIYRPKSMILSAASYVYNGRAKKPEVEIKGRDGNVISKEYYTTEYSGDCKNIGQYMVRVTFQGKYSGMMQQSFTILPQATKLTKVSGKPNGILLQWKKGAKQVEGYQIQYDTSSKFKGAKTVNVNKRNTVSRKISKLKPKKNYYVRIRTYRKVKVGGRTKTLYSPWSASKKVTTKR